MGEDTALPVHEAINVTLRVDRDGRAHVVSMNPAYEDGPLPVRCRAPLLGEIAKWRYRPFEDSQGPVAVQIIETVPVYPVERWRNPRAPFPAHFDLRSAHVVLERSGCYGSCPVYRLELRGDGAVLYEGYEFVAEKGVRRGTVDDAEFAALIEEFREADFFSLLDAYEAPITDLATYRLTLEVGGQRQTVTDYWGEIVGMPSIVRRLERRVDEVGHAEQWTGRTS
jgi:hypothetical protein